MKWTFAATLAVAPVVLAKSVHNVYPLGFDRRSPNRDNSNSRGSEHGGLITDTVVEEEIIILWINPGNNAATTTVNAPQGGVTATAVQNGQTASAVAPPGAAQTHNVTVGGTSVAYSPDTIQAAIGDTVIFTFLSANHTVTQSAFASPCEKLDGGMDTGFQPNPNNSVNPPPKVAMQVTSSGPLWFYCRQKGHCGKGMTFSINPTAQKTQAMFQSMAIAQNGTGSPSAITGGQSSAVAPPPAASSESASASVAAGTPPSATDAASGAAASGVVAGVGTLNGDGSCSCQVLCAAGSFPAAVQGIGAFGGVGGALPMTTGTA